MTVTRRSFTHLLAGAALLAPYAARAADRYPMRPITLIVPFAPGGGNDTLGRLIGRTIEAPLGQPVVVDNKPGAGGSVGAQLAARAPGDGYTLFLGGVGSHALNPAVNPKVGYDPERDFTPIIWLANAPMVLAAHPSVPANTVKELIAYAKKNPGKLNFASNGNGSSSQLAAVIFNTMAGTEMVHVPYKGLAPAMVDLLAGNVQLMFSSSVAIMPSVQAGKLKVLGVTSANRMASLPNVPTIAEEGLAGYETGSWYGILGPAGMPAPVVERLNQEINKALANPDVKASLATDGALPVGGTPARFAEHIRSEVARLRQYSAQIKLD
ncbi:tripartite tricarboxylate transporter substrate binding protein [Ramlibacter sp. G-1-2-2]|uniref:Tripartite tricarboxylate transporter substrate binding protein n=1 Tax=Ramlibacter agri TaxID=2728837 RepID=A0A848HD21_9BURK|nr:tripartite tricarboxylate transporter substrate binding protein [Ramlibacter agri]NML48364.1 tripartite tricarboxylate transporter substrate binding protein [Ramlibacter agri]